MIEIQVLLLRTCAFWFIWEKVFADVVGLHILWSHEMGQSSWIPGWHLDAITGVLQERGRGWGGGFHHTCRKGNMKIDRETYGEAGLEDWRDGAISQGKPAVTGN